MAGAKLQAIDLWKLYPGTTALAGVSLEFAGGQVHALLGKNGAGKSTLVKIFSGAVQPTRGQIVVDGRPVRMRSPREAFRQGIATVYQELSLVPELTVAENILFGRLPKRRLLGRWIIDWPSVYRQAQTILDDLGIDLDIRAKAGHLGMAQQQLVEIAKAMSFAPSVLLLDEPTSALAHHEVDRLLELVRSLARRGTAVIYISHRLQELPQVADVVSVLRDGRAVGTIPIGEATPERLVDMMFAQTIHGRRAGAAVVAGPTVLEVRRLSRRGKLDDVSFSLGRGEILGIAGMLGSGRTELLMSIFGAERFDSGEILIEGRPARRHNPGAMKRMGLGLIPEKRKEQGLVGMLSVRDNLCLASLSRIAWRGLIWRTRQDRVVQQLIQRLHITLSDSDQSVDSLSGGNQQKVVVGNWLNTQPRILLFDEPTRGIDVAAKQQIFEIIRDLSRQGISSVLVSSELEELLDICHRMLILRKGRLAGEMRVECTSLDQLFRACMEP
jgi:ribose transport system ATP-binding protein